jgi:hypothetical protein
MKDKELEIVIERLEQQEDLSTADYDGIVKALHYLLPDQFAGTRDLDRHVDTLDGAMRCVTRAYPNWTVDIHGSSGSKGGYWRCTLREGDTADNDAAIGSGHASEPSRALLAALFRLTAALRRL